MLRRKSRETKNEVDQQKRVMVQLDQIHRILLGSSGTSPLSFHCQEREVVAAL